MSAPDVRAGEEEAELETSSFCDNTALKDPRERPREQPLGDRRVVAGQGSPPLEVCDDSDSNFYSQKIPSDDREVCEAYRGHLYPPIRVGILAVFISAFYHGIFKTSVKITHTLISHLQAAVEMQRTDLWTQSGKEKVGWMERVAWKHVHYHM